MKKYLALLLFALVTTVALGQNDYQDVVYLKNGSIIKGIIIEQIPNKSIKIETVNKSVFVCQMDEIKKLAKERFQVKHDGSLRRSGLSKGIIEFGYLFGRSGLGIQRLNLDIIYAYQVNPYISLGFGTGLQYYFTKGTTGIYVIGSIVQFNYNFDITALPIFADFRVTFIDAGVAPYLALGIGYSFSLDNNLYPFGFLFNPALGFRFKLSNQSEINVSLGHDIQDVKQDLKHPFYGISINIGLSF